MYSNSVRIVLVTFALLLIVLLFRGGKAYDGYKKVKNTESSSQNWESLWIEVNDRVKAHALYGGKKSNTVFILIHGASSKQDSKHWSVHFNFLANRGTFYAIDLLGYGLSEGAVPSPQAQVEVFQKLYEFILNKHHDSRIFIISRSYGSSLTLDWLRKEISKASESESLYRRLKGVVMISPALTHETLNAIPTEITSLPILIVWAKDDEVNYYQGEATNVLNAFPSAKLLIFQQIRVDDLIPEWMTHSPELIKIEEFQKSVDLFINASDKNQEKNI